jgi:hypothetical protein
MNPNTITFQDPTVPDLTNGVVLFSALQGQNAAESDETCTLSSSQKPLCTAVLNDFISKDWRMG